VPGVRVAVGTTFSSARRRGTAWPLVDTMNWFQLATSVIAVVAILRTSGRPGQPTE
jgi:hypothetical protein